MQTRFCVHAYVELPSVNPYMIKLSDPMRYVSICCLRLFLAGFFICTNSSCEGANSQGSANDEANETSNKQRDRQDTSSQEFKFQAGKVTTIADDIDAGAGGLTIDKEGNLYTADFGWRLDGRGKGGNKIYKIDRDGKISLFNKEMRGASGNTMDADGNLYQSSIGGNFVSKIDSSGKSAIISRTGLRSPVGIALGSEKELFVCNCGGNSIQRIEADGTSKIYSKSNLFRCPNGIARAEDGTLYVCNFGNGGLIKISPDGKASQLATIPGRNNGHLVLHEDSLFVVSRGSHRIYQVSLDGEVKVFAGSGKRGKADGAAERCSFSLPNSITVSPDGRYLFINETSPTTGDPKILGPTRIRRIELIRK